MLSPAYRIVTLWLALLTFFACIQRVAAQTTNVVYNQNFDTPTTLVWSGSGDGVGSFAATVVTNLANNGFPSAPTSGYLALTANSLNKATNSGWWGVGVLANVSTPGGLGQTNLGKISLTGKVRAKGLPPTGAVAILRIMEKGDNPGSQGSAYKRITFEPILLEGGDWQTIGGRFDDASLQTASGSRYNFSTTNTSYEITVELSGYNQSTDPSYVAYNSPTGTSNAGRKNPGLAPNSAIRVEFDDIRLAVENPAAQTTAIGTVSPKAAGVGSAVTITGVAFGSSPTVRFNGTAASSVTVNGDGTSITAVVPAGATTGKITVVGSNATATSASNFIITSPTNLLADPNFDTGQPFEFWTHFEGARLITASNVAPDANTAWNDVPGAQANTPYMFIPGWYGAAYAGFMQNQIAFNPSNGSFFTLTFQAKFEENYSAEGTFVTFMNGTDTETFRTVDINDEVQKNLGRWATYTVSYNASPAQLAAMGGRISVKIQPLGRSVGAEMASAFFDALVLTQQEASLIGPQLTVKVGGASCANGATASLFAPLIGYTTHYAIVLQNDGAEPLDVSSVSLSGTSFVLSGITSGSLQPGESRVLAATAEPGSNDQLDGTLTVLSNDKEADDQTFLVNLRTTPVSLADNFDSGTASGLGWTPVYAEGSTTFDTAATVSVANGALRLVVDSETGAGTYPWYYGVRKAFASPGSIDLANSSLVASLKASGLYNEGTPIIPFNRVQIYLESLNSSGAATGRISLGQWVDETTAGADPGVGSYFSPDGINDRVAVLLPEGGDYTTVGGPLPSAIDAGFNPNAPAFQIVVLMTDFEFDLDADNVVEIDAMNLVLATQPFAVANGGFEDDGSDFGAGSAPSGWLQFPPDGVSKNLVAGGASVYSASLLGEDPNVPFVPYAGTKSAKIYAQNFYNNQGVWVGPNQTGTVYQEWAVGGTAGLSVGETIHARGVANVYGIDPLTGGSTFRYGFRYMDALNVPVAADNVTTIAASNAVNDRWVPLVANGTVPAGAAKVQLVAEFVQNNASDSGAVYLDDLSVGFGQVPAAQDVGGTNYQLVWSDEFNGSALNTANWTAEIGTGNNGWGNQEAQYYTDRPENLRVENGRLVIEAIKENYLGSSWTSARIKTQDKRSFQYGKIEFRAKLPSGIGPWPAAWMLGTNISTVGWPQCGEIDVMEWRGSFGEANTVGHALHSATRHGGNPVEPQSRTPVTNPSTEFHTYAVVWDSNSLTFSVDGVDVATLTPPAPDAEVFRKEFFLLLNLAMGGVYNGGQIDPALTRATYEVDYVRVYQASSSSSDTTPPALTLNGAPSVNVPWGSSYVDAGATAFDQGDNMSVPVVTNNPVDTSVPGSYLVSYSAADSTGNSGSTSRTVVVAMANGGTNRGTDGLSDISRYAFGGTGTNALAQSLMPTSTMSNIGGTNHLVLTYFARTNANIATVPMVSTNLGNTNWTTNGVSVNVLQTVSTNNMLLEKRQATTPISGSRKFLRLHSILTTP